MYFGFQQLEAAIDTLHPLRWGIAVGAGLLALILAAFVIAKLTGESGDRWLRLLYQVLAAELLILIVLATIGFVYEHHAEARDGKLYPPPGRMLDIGGYRLHLNCMGEGGPTVVLEYGLEGSYFDWYRVQPEIAKFARVCSYDRAGYGWSDSSGRPRAASVIAEELHALLHAAGEKPPYILIGHSFGAMVAQVFAHKFAQDTRGLILVDSLVLRGTPWFPLSHRIWLRSMEWTTPLGLPRWRGWCGGAVPVELRPAALAANCRSKVYAAYYEEHLHLAESGREVSEISSLGTMPLVVISRDPAAGRDRSEEERHAEEQRELLKLSSNARMIVAQGSGHAIPLVRPDLIVEAARGLVNAPAGAGSQGTR